MFCTACKEEGATEKDSVFVKGSTVMRQDGIKYHEVSDRHKRAIEKKLAQTTPVHDTDDDDDDENEMAEDSFFFDNVLYTVLSHHGTAFYKNRIFFRRPFFLTCRTEHEPVCIFQPRSALHPAEL
jgi:hypothetical protein